MALDCHIFETIISRLHGIYALSLNSIFDPNTNQKPPARLCFERLPKLTMPSAITCKETPLRRRREPRRTSYQKHKSCLGRFVESPSSRCNSCISFGMFDSSSPCNPGQLFCPVKQVSACACSVCGRNLTSGSSLISVAGSSESGLEKRHELCYSMTRSMQFCRLTRGNEK